MKDEEDTESGPHAGELASKANMPAIAPNGLKQSAFCECGRQAMLVVEGSRFVGYSCPEHGPLTHDAIVWAWTGETDLF